MQVDIGGTAPFLALNEKKILMLFPLISLRNGSPEPGNPTSFAAIPHASIATEFPLEKWIHVGCKVCFKHIASKVISLKFLL